MLKTFVYSVYHDLLIYKKSSSHILIPLFFYLLISTIFGFSLSSWAKYLNQAGPVIIWVSSVLAILLSLDRIYKDNFESGTLEQHCFAKFSLQFYILAKMLAHFIAICIPIIILTPLLAIFYNLETLTVVTIIETQFLALPTLTLIGTVGAAMTVGIRQGGLLMSLLVIPLYLPILIFATSAAVMVNQGLQIDGQYAFLAGILLVSIVFAPSVVAFVFKLNWN